MKGLIVNAIAGTGLFAGALVGGLMATGRWNHEGVANIPVLNMMFPAPPADAADGAGDPHGADPHATADGAAKDADHGAGAKDAHDAASDGAAHGAPADGSHTAATQDPKRLPLPTPGKSVFQKEDKKGGGGHGEPAAGHGETKDAHGDAAKKDAHGADAAHPPAAPAGEMAHGSMPERDFAQVGNQLKKEPGVRYQPGALFRFDGMPAGVTPDQLNAAWKRVQDGLAEIERRTKAVEIQEQELREFSEDVARRQTEVGKERAEVEAMQRRLDERVEQFQDQIKLIRNDEVAGLKRNAQHLANFEPKKAVEIITEQWKTDAGQVEVLKLLEFMSKDDVDEILAEMPTTLVRDVMQKRLKVTKEPAPAATPKK